MCKRSVDIWGHLYHVLSVNSLIVRQKGYISGMIANIQLFVDTIFFLKEQQN